MLWKHLRNEIQRLERAGHLTDWTETGVDGFNLTPWGVALDVEADADLLNQLEDRKREVEKLESAKDEAEAESHDAETRADKVEKEAAKLREELAELRDPASGVTVATYRNQATEAEDDARTARETARLADRRTAEMAVELTAMRKRKGVEPGVMAHTRDVMGLLHSLTSTYREAQWQENAKRELDRYKSDAERLLAAIQATAKAGTTTVAATKAGKPLKAAA